MRVAAQPFDCHVSELVLLALDHIGKAGIVPEHAEIKLDDKLAAGSIPDAEFRLNQPAACNLIVETQIGEHFECCCVSGCSSRAVVHMGFRLQHVHWNVLLCKRECHDDAYRPATSDQDRQIRRHRAKPSKTSGRWT